MGALLKRNWSDVVEVLATRPSKHIRHVRQVYKNIYNKELPEIVKNTFKEYDALDKFLCSLLTFDRDSNNVVNTENIEKDKLRMQQSLNESTWGSDVMIAETVEMLSTRSFGYLWYLVKQGFKAEEFQDWKFGILNLVSGLENSTVIQPYTQAVFVFLEVLHSRQEYDLKDIKLCYRNNAPVNLEKDLLSVKTKSFDCPLVLEAMIKDYLQA